MIHRKFAAVAAALACAAGSACAAELTFTSWGGAWQDAQVQTAAKPFGAANQVRIKTDTYNGGIAQIRSQVQTGNVTWDVVDLQLSDAVRACDEGLLEKVGGIELEPAADGSPAAGDFLDGALSECLVGNITWSTVIAYNADRFKGRAPASIRDFFDLANFPGKRALRKSPEGALEWALLADGVKPEAVYQVLATSDGLARAFKKLDTIKSSVVWWETGAQPAQLLADGEVTMSSAYNGRIYSAIAQDKRPFAFLWDGQVVYNEGYAIVKGSKNLKEAKAFVRYATRPDVLAKLPPLTAYGLARRSAAAMIDPALKPYLPTTPENARGAVRADVEFWADHADDLNQKFAVWLAQK
ncbi:MAG: ABC transporter substrate-binding protein [Comamonas sp.]